METTNEVHIDGRLGEGGGQVFRTSLSLAAALGRPVVVTGVRGGRRKPGLLRQHRTALRAVAEITGGEVDGDELGSTTVRFAPGTRPRGGDYRFGIGSAGSTMLVLQTVLPPLLLADGPSTVTLEGGTHNPSAPPYECFSESFCPCLRAMGAEVVSELLRPGFYPAGGGSVRLSIRPVSEPRPLELLEAGERGRPSLEVISQGLAEGIAEREWKAFQKRLHWTRDRLTHTRIAGGRGPGNVMLARLPAEHLTTVLAGFGSPGITSEQVGGRLAGRVRAYEKSGAVVDEHLADQLMLPMALLAGGAYRCAKVTSHASTNAEVICAFLPGAVRVEPSGGLGSAARIRVQGARS